jgi:hypothetical protein
MFGEHGTTVQFDRESLEAGSTLGDSRSPLRDTRRSREGRQRLLRSLASAGPSAEKAMIHYLRRCVDHRTAAVAQRLLARDVAWANEAHYRRCSWRRSVPQSSGGEHKIKVANSIVVPLDAKRMPKLQFWQAVTQLSYDTYHFSDGGEFVLGENQ